jgi:hypothetical protein
MYLAPKKTLLPLWPYVQVLVSVWLIGQVGWLLLARYAGHVGWAIIFLITCVDVLRTDV